MYDVEHIVHGNLNARGMELQRAQGEHHMMVVQRGLTTPGLSIWLSSPRGNGGWHQAISAIFGGMWPLRGTRQYVLEPALSLEFQAG
jgi:hypothetical protein